MPYGMEGNSSSFIQSPIYNRTCIHGGHIILEEFFLKEPESLLPKPKKQESPVSCATGFSFVVDVISNSLN